MAQAGNWFLTRLEVNNMKRQDESSTGKKHSHNGHMWMMAICCGVPIVGLLTILWLGISMPSLETALYLICPIGMVAMMYMMHRRSDSDGREDQKAETRVASADEREERSSTVIRLDAQRTEEKHSSSFRA